MLAISVKRNLNIRNNGSNLFYNTSEVTFNMKNRYIKIGILILIIVLLSILGLGYINHKEADLTREKVLECFENNNDMFDGAVKKLKQHSDRYQIYNDGTYEGDYKDKNILDFMRITKCEEIKKTEDLIIFEIGRAHV